MLLFLSESSWSIVQNLFILIVRNSQPTVTKQFRDNPRSGRVSWAPTEDYMHPWWIDRLVIVTSLVFLLIFQIIRFRALLLSNGDITSSIDRSWYWIFHWFHHLLFNDEKEKLSLHLTQLRLNAFFLISLCTALKKKSAQTR